MTFQRLQNLWDLRARLALGQIGDGFQIRLPFQQLFEQYQEAVLQAAREVDDAAVGFARTGEQIVLLAETVQAAQRSLNLATLQYREGLADFQRVIDSQRVLFSQQDLLVTTRGGLTQNLITLYKAMGGGWEAGRSRPVVDVTTRETMSQRSDWKGLLTAPLPPAAAFCSTRHIIQIIYALNLERNVPVAFDEGQVATRIGNLGQQDDFAVVDAVLGSHDTP